jgi:hypothetical protein
MLEWIEKHKLPIFIAIVIVIIIMIIFVYNCKANNRYLDGLWIGDEEFCAESALTGFWIMIGEVEMAITGSTSSMYIVMFNEEGMLCNRNVDVQIGHSIRSSSGYVNRNLTILNEDFDMMPKYMTLSVNSELGHMVLYGRDKGVDQDEDTIFGTFYKDNESSHKAKLLRTE